VTTIGTVNCNGLARSKAGLIMTKGTTMTLTDDQVEILGFAIARAVYGQSAVFRDRDIPSDARESAYERLLRLQELSYLLSDARRMASSHETHLISDQGQSPFCTEPPLGEARVPARRSSFP
jgi:hypothetical protein